MDIYEVVKSIGSGNFGQVYLVRHKYEGKHYVLKKIATGDMGEKERENAEQEVRLLQKLRHANVVAYKDSYNDRQQFLCIVMMYCEGGDMYSKIKSAKGKKFSEAQILEWIAQVLLALLYLHERKILHRDLKTQNIFLKNNRLRLGDFGIAKMLDGTRDCANTCIGTPYYMSPELFKNKPYSYKSDIWALGCVVYEMCNLRHAFDAQSFNGLAMKILKASYPPISPSYSKGLRDLITQMLSTNPSQRPSPIDLVNHPLIKKHLVIYLRDSLTNTEDRTDLDEVNIDSLREQAEKYGLMQYVKGESKVQQALSDNKEEIEAQLLEKKQKLENELNEIKEKKRKIKNSESERANELERKHQKKQEDAEKRREQIIQEKRRKASILSKKQTEDTEEETKKPKEPKTARDRVLEEKERRKRQEQQRIQAQLKQLYKENEYNRQFAKEKKESQLRSSSVLQRESKEERSFEEPIPEEPIFEEPYEEEEDFIGSDSEEEDYSYFKVREQNIKAELTRTNNQIEKLRESVLEDGLRSVEEEPCEDDEEAQEDLPTWHYKLKDRIKLLTHRCEAGIGHQLFEQAYDRLKNLSGQDSTYIRSSLIEVLGEQNIGYWSLLDQIIFLENSLA